MLFGENVEAFFINNSLFYGFYLFFCLFHFEAGKLYSSKERKAFELSGNFRTFLLDFQYRTLPRTRHSIFLTRFILILRDANEISLQLPLLAES